MPVTVIINLPTQDSDTLVKTINESSQADRILTSARDHGLLTHRFIGGDNGILVIDQWPTQQAFEAFFNQNNADIRQMLAPVMPAGGQPEITVYTNLQTRDAYPEGEGGTGTSTGRHAANR